jgi:ankyrin repeat protein
LARKGDLENVRLFLEFGASIHARDDEFGSTPLGWAARSGQTEMVALLIEQGAWPEPPGPEWASARRWAERGNRTEILALLDGATAAT